MSCTTVNVFMTHDGKGQSYAHQDGNSLEVTKSASSFLLRIRYKKGFRVLCIYDIYSNTPHHKCDLITIIWSKNMNTKRSTLFWLSVITIALLSIIFSFYTKNSNITTSISSKIFKLTYIKSGIYEFFSLINQIFGRVYRWLTCDPNKWNSPLIGKYGVGLTLTVDQKGCGKFNSLQKAVNAVPDHAPKPTLIIVDAGTYK